MYTYRCSASYLRIDEWLLQYYFDGIITKSNIISGKQEEKIHNENSEMGRTGYAIE